jgi:pimeloyl-ACP methyl ester carboxylesterase
MSTQHDVHLADGRVLRVHDGGANRSPGSPVLLWHHGSPQTGALIEPLLDAAVARGIRLLGYGRPAYGGSTPNPGRDVASAARDVEQVMDALGIERFAVMGASGGGPHALACAALLPERVVGAVTLAGIAPYTNAFDWYSGMISPGGLRAAADGREARERFAATDEFDERQFIGTDWAALTGAWASLGRDAEAAGSAGPDGLIDDDVAFAKPWGFDPAQIPVRVLLVQGGEDRVVPRSHAEWLLGRIPTAELWLRPRDGHVSVLAAVPIAMDWLLASATPRR